MPTAAPATPFQHLQAAHCESGVIASMLRHEGVAISEAMAFGLSAALSFAYIPLIKINQLPLISYRMMPRWILKGVRRQLQLPLRFETFRSPLDGRLVGLQASVYFLPYFPANMRFHFNAHNLIAYGREGDDYLVSDPVFNNPTRCAGIHLQKARFVRGALAPKGLIYHLDGPVTPVAVAPLLRGAIRKNALMMQYVPLPFVSCSGIQLLARRVRRLPFARDPEFCRRFVGHIVRMQEEIGTGGAGFRFLYAAFLQEAASLLARPVLNELSLELTAIGDQWRDFALHAARMNKGREDFDGDLLGDALAELGRRERRFFRALWRAV